MSLLANFEPQDPPKSVINLLVAEESVMDCELLKNALNRTRHSLRITASAVSQAEVLHLMNSRCPDAALISSNLRDGPMTGLAVLREIRNSFPKVNTVVLLKSESPDIIVAAFRAGAKGVFCREQPMHLLSKCMNAVQQGQIWADSSQLRLVLDAFASERPLKLVNSHGRALLTKREIDVVKLVIDGHSNRNAAKQLGLTEHTVSNYLFKIYEKLGISSRVELVLYSLKAR
jgi:two-component system nitrate/nitrite response regulator NarL